MNGSLSKRHGGKTPKRYSEPQEWTYPRAIYKSVPNVHLHTRSGGTRFCRQRDGLPRCSKDRMPGHLSHCLSPGKNNLDGGPCENANEAMVSRDITTLISPPIKALRLLDQANRFEDFNDEVNTQWYESWVLAGPRPKPDLAVSILFSAFMVEENQKVAIYTFVENLTRPTNEMCFPFLMCKVKCGNVQRKA